MMEKWNGGMMEWWGEIAAGRQGCLPLRPLAEGGSGRGHEVWDESELGL